MRLCDALRLDQAPTPHVIALTGGGGKTSTLYRLAAELTAQGKRVICTASTRLAAYEVESTPGIVEAAPGVSLPELLNSIRTALDRHNLCLLVTPEIVDAGVKKYPGVSTDIVDALAARADEIGVDAVIVEADGAKMLPLKAPAEHEPQIPASTTILLSFVGMDAVGLSIAKGTVHRPDIVRNVLGLPESAAPAVTPRHFATLLASANGGRKHCPTGARYFAVLNKADTDIQRACARISARLLRDHGIQSLITSTGNEDMEAVHERWAPISVIVLAGGEASRYGAPKQLAVVDGEPLIVRAVRNARQSGADEVIVVTGAYADQTRECLAQHMDLRQPWLRVVHNARWNEGQATSMHAGLNGLAQGTQAVIFMPVDQPFLPLKLLRRLNRAWQLGADLVTPNVDGQMRGSPALFDCQFWAELLAVKGDVGGRDILAQHADQIVSIPASATELQDIDYPHPSE